MQEKIKQIASDWGGFNRISKKILRYGLLFSALLYLTAVILFAAAGRAGEYYVLMRYHRELLQCASDVLSVILVSAVFLEAVVRFRRFDRMNER